MSLLVDLKGQLLARRANLQTELSRSRGRVVMLEAELIGARRAADLVEGRLAGIDEAIQAVPDDRSATPPPCSGGSSATPPR